MKCETILFDINETVLDLSSLKPKFNQAFGSEAVTSTWFSMLLHSSTVCSLTGVSTTFAALAGSMLDSLAARMGVDLPVAQRDDILQTFANLRAHPDVVPALIQLRSAGYSTVAFSNSSLELVTSQITNAGLVELFDELISVEETGSFKPDPRVYQFAAQRVNRSVEQLRLVATHDWDTHGAMTAGMQAAYIDRSGSPYHPLYRRPEISATTMTQVATLIIDADKSK